MSFVFCILMPKSRGLCGECRRHVLFDVPPLTCISCLLSSRRISRFVHKLLSLDTINMDDSTYGIIKFLFPRIPSFTKTALAHSLWLSPTSSKWDLKTEMTVAFLRSLMNGGPSPIGQTQAQTLKDPGAKGKVGRLESTYRSLRTKASETQPLPLLQTSEMATRHTRNRDLLLSMRSGQDTDLEPVPTSLSQNSRSRKGTHTL